MAGEVNPQVNPTNDPSYLRYSKTIGDIPVPTYNLKGDESGKYGLTAAGEAISGVAQIGDEFMKETIKDDAHKQYDPISDAYTAQLQMARNQLTNPTATMPNTDILPDDNTAPSNIPPGLANGLDKVRSIGNAAKDPKVTDTLYLGRMDAVLKNLRAQYPGYVDYVDKVSQQVTGKNIANEYRDSMVKDLNIALSGINSQRNEIQKLWDQNIDKLDPRLHDMWLSGKLPGGDSGAWAYIHGELAKDSQIKSNMAQLSLMTQAGAALKENATDVANSLVGDIVTKGWQTQKLMLGEQSPQDLAALVQLSANGKGLDDGQAKIAGQQLEAYKQASYAKSWQEMYRVRPEMGNKSLSDLLGPAKTNEVLEGNHKIFDIVKQAIYDKDYGLAHAHFNQAEAILDKEKHYVLTTPTLGSYMARINALTALSGPLFMPEAIKQGLVQDMDGKSVPLFTDTRTSAAVQPTARQGKPTTLAGSIDNAQSQGVKDPRFYRSLTGIVDDITNPNASPEVKKNAAVFAFDPKNRGVLQKYDADYTDPVTGKPVQGRYKAFSVLTDPKITKALHDLNDPDSWNNYKGFAQNEFMHSLFQNELGSLKDLQDNKHLHLSLDTAKNRLVLTDENGGAPAGGVANTSNRTVANLNWGIAHLEQIFKADGTDVNSYMQNVLKYYGFNVKQNAEVGKSNFTEENKPDTSLQTFVHNPASMRKVFNYSDEDLLSIHVDDIPEGMSARDFIKSQKEKRPVIGQPRK